MERIEFNKILSYVFWFSIFVVLCKLTSGWALVPAAMAGVWFCFSWKRGWALALFAFLPIVTTMNPMLVPAESYVTVIARITLIVMCAMMALMGSIHNAGKRKIPLGGLILYLLVACVSSARGWAPNVSYMKIFNFLLFILAIWYGTQNLERNPHDVLLLHRIYFVLVLILAFGSIATIPFPAIAYQQYTLLTFQDMDVESAALAVRQYLKDGNMMVFAGVMNNSQCLGPLLALSFNWVLCDMLFVAQKMSKVHIITLVATIIPLYLTRSRTALFALGIGVCVIFFMTMSRISIPQRIKQRARSMMWGVFIVAILAAIGMELHSHTMSRWIRKTNDVAGDRRGFSEALTSSRDVLNENNWRDFHKNPWLGMGFQVMPFHQKRYAGKLFVFSAPIEKGLLPLMILGETGVVGAIAFSIFLLMFFTGCKKLSLNVTAAMFVILCASNIGEATFFSPGGSGGTLWIVGVVGGYAIDMMVLNRRQFDKVMMANGRPFGFNALPMGGAPAMHFS